MATQAFPAISLVNLRNSLGEIINKASFGHERTFVSKNGKTVAAIVPIEDIELLEALEDRADLEALRDARGADDGTRISWAAYKSGHTPD